MVVFVPFSSVFWPVRGSPTVNPLAASSSAFSLSGPNQRSWDCDTDRRQTNQAKINNFLLLSKKPENERKLRDSWDERKDTARCNVQHFSKKLNCPSDPSHLTPQMMMITHHHHHLHQNEEPSNQSLLDVQKTPTAESKRWKWAIYIEWCEQHISHHILTRATRGWVFF